MITKKFFIKNLLIIIILSIVISRLSFLKNKSSFYQEQYLLKSNNIVSGYNAPRGRILDRNGVVLVDNYSQNIITYRQLSGVDAMETAEKLLSYIEFLQIPTQDELISYHLSVQEPTAYLTDDEKQKYAERKLTSQEIQELQKKRVSLKELAKYDIKTQKAIKIYNLMHQGYSYSTKVIKSKNVSNEECARIQEANIPGITCELSWYRKIIHDEVSSIFGSTSKIPEEDKEYYLSLGYQLDDIVGISYLEKQYDNYLKGTKSLYTINPDNSLTLYQEGSKGHDLKLSLDLKLIKKIDSIIKENLQKSLTLQKTEYFNSAYVIVSSPKTGSILAMNGVQILKDHNDYTFKDITPNIINSSYTMGSVIKGASMTVGYLNDLIDPNQKIYDSCVKLHFVPAKCSHKSLGWLNDISALQTSSNYYQFLLAIALTNQKYSYNMDLNVTKEHFDIYRKTFQNFGLGSLTGIDLPGETTGIKGSIIADDLYLNLAIGQYDTYTPIGLSQYINTIANNGQRVEMHLIDSINSKNQIIYQYSPKILSNIKDTGYFARIKEGMRQVLDGGTGRGYVNPKYKPAGKTGTSESYYNKDVTTITQTFAAFAPVDNPEYSIVVITPNVSYNTKEKDEKYIAPINRYISKAVSQFVFENY